jgi:hypothetical protein
VDPELVGDVTFVLHCLHVSELGFRQYLTNDNYNQHGNNRVYGRDIGLLFSQSRDREIKSSQQCSLKMLWKNRKYYSKKLFSLNSSVMDDNHDTYKTANIKINQLF